MPAMIDEIHAQPKVVQDVVQKERRSIEMLCKAVKSRDIACVILAGRGTSDHAATVAKYLIEITNGIPVALAAPSVVTLYHSRLNLSRCLVVGISQAGQSPDVVEYVSQAKAWGALTACVCNDADSGLAKAADYCIFCHAGEEKSVVTTKTYMASLAACYLLGITLAGNNELMEQFARVPEVIQNVLALEPTIRDMAPRYRYMDECFVLARGVNHATAQEAAAKISETSYVGAWPYSIADFAHGPIAAVHEGLSCFVFAPGGKAFSSAISMIQTLSQKRAETIVYSDSDEALRRATMAVRLPSGIDELLTPLVYIVPAQLFAYYLSITKGYNPDRPRGLSKVTLTK